MPEPKKENAQSTHGGGKTVPYLCDAPSEDWVAERRRIREMNRDLRAIVAKLRGDLEEDEWYDQLRLFASHTCPEAFAIARELCASTCSDDRGLGVALLGRLRFNDDYPMPEWSFLYLLGMLERESDDEVLGRIAGILEFFNDPRKVAPLVKLQAHPSSKVRNGVVFGLMRRHEPEAVTTLITLMQDDNRDVRDWATHSIGSQLHVFISKSELGYVDSAEIRAALRSRLSDSDEEIRSEAILGLAYRKCPEVLDILKAELAKPEIWPGVFEAAEELGDERLYPLLLECRERFGTEDPPDCFDTALEWALEACAPRAGNHL